MNRESVAGGPPVFVSVSDSELDASTVLGFVDDPAAGCSVLFTGTVRDHSEGRPGVTELEYEAYIGVAEGKIAEIVREAFERWDIRRVAAVHRVGVLVVGEPTVMVAVSAGHRVDAFPAARYIIDELKARAPIWKKERWGSGEAWVGSERVEPA
jgi:molybdopterin synthase catalytic subunit